MSKQDLEDRHVLVQNEDEDVYREDVLNCILAGKGGLNAHIGSRLLQRSVGIREVSVKVDLSVNAT